MVSSRSPVLSCSAARSPARATLMLLFVGLLVASLLVALSVAPAQARSQGELFAAVNDARNARGLAPVAAYQDTTMATRANEHAIETGTFHGLHNDAFGWYRERGATRFRENQANFPETGASAFAVVEAWLDSPGHADNLLATDVSHAAIAVRTVPGDPSDRTYFTLQLVDDGGTGEASAATEPDASDEPDGPSASRSEPAVETEPSGEAEAASSNGPAPAPPSESPSEPVDPPDVETEPAPEDDGLRSAPLDRQARAVLSGVAGPSPAGSGAIARASPVSTEHGLVAGVVRGLDDPAPIVLVSAHGDDPTNSDEVGARSAPVPMLATSAPGTSDLSLVVALMVFAALALLVSGGWLGHRRQAAERGSSR